MTFLPSFHIFIDIFYFWLPRKVKIHIIDFKYFLKWKVIAFFFHNYIKYMVRNIQLSTIVTDGNFDHQIHHRSQAIQMIPALLVLHTLEQQDSLMLIIFLSPFFQLALHSSQCLFTRSGLCLVIVLRVASIIPWWKSGGSSHNWIATLGL